MIGLPLDGIGCAASHATTALMSACVSDFAISPMYSLAFALALSGTPRAQLRAHAGGGRAKQSGDGRRDTGQRCAVALRTGGSLRRSPPQHQCLTVTQLIYRRL